jgi:hypothetical protein
VLRKHAAAVFVDLDLADDGHPGALKAELEAADAGEQREDVEAHQKHSPAWIKKQR